MPQSPLVVNGIPTYGAFTTEWVIAKSSLSTPLGAAVYDHYLPGLELGIAAKRNQIVQTALNLGARYVLFIGDDTILPSHAFMTMFRHMKHDPEVKIVTGVYFSRTIPPQPMIWRKYMTGSYYDWRVGEFFEVDWAGCDCLLVDTEVFRNLPKPWFSQDYVFESHQSQPSESNTEDIYFFEKARAAGYKAWCDSSVQCQHQDRNSGMIFQLPADWPQWRGGPKSIPSPGSDHSKLIADIGCGYASPYSPYEMIRFDPSEEVMPDIRCDLHTIPYPDQSFDQVLNRLNLQTFPAYDSTVLIQEWSRVLKVGGTIEVTVPDLESAMINLLTDDKSEVNWQAIFGRQISIYDKDTVHKTGFTKKALASLIEYAWGGEVMHGIDANGDPSDGIGCYDHDSIFLEVRDPGSITVTATKMRHPRAAQIGPEGRHIDMYESGITKSAIPSIEVMGEVTNEEFAIEAESDPVPVPRLSAVHHWIIPNRTPGNENKPFDLWSTTTGINELARLGAFANLGEPHLSPDDPSYATINPEDRTDGSPEQQHPC